MRAASPNHRRPAYALTLPQSRPLSLAPASMLSPAIVLELEFVLAIEIVLASELLLASVLSRGRMLPVAITRSTGYASS